MISIDEMETILNDIAGEFPPELLKELNGGMILLPDVKLHERHLHNDLYVLGEYRVDRALGRCIVIFYGSFMRVHGNLSCDRLKEKLTHTLKHEFRHHLESMAGEKALEQDDARYIENYLRNHR